MALGFEPPQNVRYEVPLRFVAEIKTGHTETVQLARAYLEPFSDLLSGQNP